jgi:hypothetical protein
MVSGPYSRENLPFRIVDSMIEKAMKYITRNPQLFKV